MRHKIRTLLTLCITLGIGAVLSSCNNNHAAQSKSINDLNYYVQQHKDSVDSYLSSKWEDLDNTYAMKRAELAKDTAQMTQQLRDSFYIIEANWQAYKKEFETKSAEHAQMAEMDNIRKAVTLDNTRLDYADLKADRIVEQYQHFVDVVKANKDNYTKEQWLVVNTSWKALNGRRKEITKDLVASDGPKIAKLQLEYTAIKAANRPFADSEEDQAQK